MNSDHSVVSDVSVHLMKKILELRSHYEALLNVGQRDALGLIDMVDRTRIQWLAVTKENSGLKAINESFRRENSKVLAELDTLKIRLRESETQTVALKKDIHGMENEISEYKRRFETIKTMLRENCTTEKVAELSFFAETRNISQSNTEDIDFDHTGDSLDETEMEETRYSRRSQPRSRDRRSQSHKPPSKRSRGRNLPSRISEGDERENDENLCPTPPKRSRENTATTKVTIDSTHVTVKRSTHRRSQSESKATEAQERYPRPIPSSVSTLNIRSPLVGFGNSWTQGFPISERQHVFREQTEMKIFNTPCTVCSKAISFASKHLKCVGEGCKYVVHKNCSKRAAVPCVPYKATPQKSKHRPRLVELCPDSRPMIPGLIMRCVVAIENDRMNFQGLYRVPGNEKEVQKLIEDMNSRVAPDLTSRDTETITSCIKKFLKGLRDPLIPANSFNEFRRAVEEEDDAFLETLINDLPVPNRDTLAYLCSHWQKVAKNGAENKMSIENLAICLGQTVIGGPLAKSQENNHDRMQEEARTQNAILLRLLRMPEDYWANFITGVPSSRDTTTPRSAMPRRIAEPLLGSALTPPSGQLVHPVSSRRRAAPLFEKPY